MSFGVGEPARSGSALDSTPESDRMPRTNNEISSPQPAGDGPACRRQAFPFMVNALPTVDSTRPLIAASRAGSDLRGGGAAVRGIAEASRCRSCWWRRTTRPTSRRRCCPSRRSMRSPSATPVHQLQIGVVEEAPPLHLRLRWHPNEPTVRSRFLVAEELHRHASARYSRINPARPRLPT